MNSKKMFLSLIPWILFTVVINHRGAAAAPYAAAAATALSGFFLVKDARVSGIKVIDVAGVATFGVLTVVSLLGSSATTDWIADYGRGAAALVLALVMLGSTIIAPFTEQYAREVVPSEYWRTPEFRAVNRKISALWGSVVAVMAVGHLIAGYLDPITGPDAGRGPGNLLLNWLLPIALIMFAINRTQRLSDSAGDDHSQCEDGAGAQAHTHARVADQPG